jgi:hypothetical protein
MTTRSAGIERLKREWNELRDAGAAIRAGSSDPPEIGRVSGAPCDLGGQRQRHELIHGNHHCDDGPAV